MSSQCTTEIEYSTNTKFTNVNKRIALYNKQIAIQRSLGDLYCAFVYLYCSIVIIIKKTVKLENVTFRCTLNGSQIRQIRICIHNLFNDNSY